MYLCFHDFIFIFNKHFLVIIRNTLSEELKSQIPRDANGSSC